MNNYNKVQAYGLMLNVFEDRNIMLELFKIMIYNSLILNGKIPEIYYDSKTGMIFFSIKNISIKKNIEYSIPKSMEIFFKLMPSMFKNILGFDPYGKFEDTIKDIDSYLHGFLYNLHNKGFIFGCYELCYSD